MKTKQYEYKTDIALLAAEIARRETRLLIAVIGIVGLAVAILKFT